MGKLVRPSFPPSESQSTEQLVLIHTDVLDLVTPSLSGSRYALVIVDDFSRYAWVYFLKKKSEVFVRLKDWTIRAERQLDKKVKTIRSDNGGEYTSSENKGWMQELGIVHQTTMAHTSQQNGVAERLNRTLVERTIAVMHSEHVPIGLWAEVMSSVMYCRNRGPSRATPRSTPYEMLYGRKPSLEHIRVIGCAAYALILKVNRERKIDRRATACAMLGYCEDKKGWRLWDIEGRKVIVSRDVAFDEHKWAFKKGSMSKAQLKETFGLRDGSNDAHASVDTVGDVDKETDGHQTPLQEALDAVGEEQTGDPQDAAGERDNQDPDDKQAERRRTHTPTPPPPDNRYWTYVPANQPPPPPRLTTPPPGSTTTRSGRISRKKVFPDHTAHVSATPTYKEELNGWMGTKSQGKDVEDRPPSDPHIVNYSYGKSPMALAAQALDMDDPKSMTEARKSKYSHLWTEAEEKEKQALLKNDVYEVVHQGEAKTRPLSAKLVFKVKRRADGEVERAKIRCVVRGFEQREGVDYHETFAPVAKFRSIRMIAALGAKRGMFDRQMDVNTAFLYSAINEDVWVTPPNGWAPPGKVWKLKKALYGLKQAPRCWYQKINQTLVNLKFQRCASDHSVYLRNDKGGLIIVSIYVDDVTIFADQQDTLENFCDAMKQEYSMKDLGPLNYILGIEVKRDLNRGTLQLTQRHFAKAIVIRYGADVSRKTSTPLPAGTIATAKKEEEAGTNKDDYLRGIGSLMYLMLGTRPDIAFAVGLLARFSNDPSARHRELMDHVYRYVYHTSDRTIEYGSSETIAMGWSDADYATADPDRRRVTSGYVFTVYGGAVSWQSKRQPSVTLATADAEYVGMCQAARELMWIRSLGMELGIDMGRGTILWGDNQACLSIAENPVSHSRSKQIDIRFHYLRELVERGVADIRYTPTADMVADGMTKAVPKAKLEAMMRSIGIKSSN